MDEDKRKQKLEDGKAKVGLKLVYRHNS